MPSKNPRVSVVLSPAVAATLAAISHETGDSMSSLVRNLLEQTGPALERMLQLVRAAKAAQGQIGAGLSSSMGRVVDDLQDAIAAADEGSARVLADLVSQAEGVSGRRRRPRAHAAGGGARAAAGGSTPVPVTRGSGPGKTRKGEGAKALEGAAQGVIEGAIDALQEAGRLTRREAKIAKASARGRGHGSV